MSVCVCATTTCYKCHKMQRLVLLLLVFHFAFNFSSFVFRLLCSHQSLFDSSSNGFKWFISNLTMKTKCNVMMIVRLAFVLISHFVIEKWSIFVSIFNFNTRLSSMVFHIFYNRIICWARVILLIWKCPMRVTRWRNRWAVKIQSKATITTTMTTTLRIVDVWALSIRKQTKKKCALSLNHSCRDQPCDLYLLAVKYERVYVHGNNKCHRQYALLALSLRSIHLAIFLASNVERWWCAHCTVYMYVTAMW